MAGWVFGFSTLTTTMVTMNGPVIRLPEPSGMGLRFQGKRRTQ